MLNKEPNILVGVYEGYKISRGEFHGHFSINKTTSYTGAFRVDASDGKLQLADDQGKILIRAEKLECLPVSDATFTLHDVTIGVHFHWERKESQTFKGGLIFALGSGGGITTINFVPLEEYLKSVISSEMSATAPEALLKAHAITSRSWLVAMLERAKQQPSSTSAQNTIKKEGEIVRWYTREDHNIYDVCADDHCQRYQGVSKIISKAAEEAVEATRGMFLVHDNEVCDARFYKACGGLTEEFHNAWEDREIAYLPSVSDSTVEYPSVKTESDAERWINSSPEAYCNTNDGNILRQVLPSFDQETKDFFRWQLEYERTELENIIREKSGDDFGTLMELIPLHRGPSGRITRLKIVGSKKTLIIGKELEIRRWLSKSHLYSSAFIVRVERGTDGIPKKFFLAGAGWGHGVGLCQIGAAVMSMKGFDPEAIVLHYFRGATVKKLY
jgi:SpoIID/LytB domain protein